ncbi:hypothetical protein I0292_26625 (plasmid) [Priestia megaterium]|uniref:hypothetical protein n=1 Tax=Priestia megaterium TaxID=1404 RepID=UPI00205DFD2A|nr:hypothetical protein [Priestia megaterium]UOO43824.1 hypothetical protein I0292_26625 [Priestia megaterium]
MVLMYLLGSAWFIFLIYRLYFKKIKTLEDIIGRGYYYRLIGLKRKEKELYLDNLKDMKLKEDEKRELIYLLGIWHAQNKSYFDAIDYFDQAFQNYNDNFYYKKEFEYVIDSYIKCKQPKKAQSLLEFFLERKKFDKKFVRLERKYSSLL